MKYRTLGDSGIRVSEICLGTMTFGQQNSEEEGHAQLDLAFGQGVNFIDTAELYPIPPQGQTQGRTEEIIGSWLARRGRRQEVVIATKVCGAADWIPHIRSGRTRLDAANIEAACEASLRRLGTDYIDLYQTHWPDRKTNFFGRLGYHPEADEEATPIEETVRALTRLVEQGKVRAIGVSNETPWGLCRYLHAEGARVVSIQNPYSLLNRSYEVGLAEFAHRERVGLLAYSPLGFGVLTGKYLGGRRPPGSRLALFPEYRRYTGPAAQAATEKYVRLAREHGLDPAQMALAFVLSRPFLTSAVIGATTLEQLEHNLASAELTLSGEVLDGIEAIHAEHPNPSP